MITQRLTQRLRSPCFICDLKSEDKNNRTCQECTKRIQYARLIAGPQSDYIPGYSFAGPQQIIGAFSHRTRTNLNPLVECKFGHCNSQTRNKSGYCHRCTMRNRVRVAAGIPLDAPLRGGKYLTQASPAIDRN